MTDINGNSAQCTANVAVQDNVDPIPQCQDITVQLTGGAATITGADVDNGSSDACGIASLDVAPNSFDCTNLGNNTVTLTVTDENGNTAQCDATVTVEDGTSPVVSCNSPATIVPPDAPISFTATASDTCGTADVTITGYDCFKFTKKGKRIDKTGSCVVAISGDTVTIHDSGGVGDNITWSVTAADGSGNTDRRDCFTRAMSRSFASALISASVTDRARAFTGARSTTTQRGSSLVGSG